MIKPATLALLKQELSTRSPKELAEICLRLARYKKENKELLSYLLYDAADEVLFVREVKLEMEQMFGEINKSHIYFVRKGIRKILRTTNKYIRFSAAKQTEAELLLSFCRLMNEASIEYTKVASLNNLFTNTLAKAAKAVSMLHPDLQFDYYQEIDALHNSNH